LTQSTFDAEIELKKSVFSQMLGTSEDASGGDNSNSSTSGGGGKAQRV